MKLWHSFLKELQLSSRGFYFYIEIFMAALLLVVLLFVVPETFNSKADEYVHLDMPQAYEDYLMNEIMDEDLDGKIEESVLTYKGNDYKVGYIESDDKKLYIFDNKKDLILLTEADKPSVGAYIYLDDNEEFAYEYYMQGYESQKLLNLYLVFHNRDSDLLTEKFDAQEVRSLGDLEEDLTDRENIIPSVLTFNGSLMGLFIIAAYIFLDKQEGIIKAYAVTPSAVWEYLMSKTFVIIVTSVLSSLIIVVPIMGLQPNYPVMLVLLITSGFFVSSVGILLSTYYDNLMQSFGALYVLMIGFMLPNIAYFIPSWEPTWIKMIPTHPLIQGFKETILTNGDLKYTLLVSLAFLVVGAIIFVYSNIRFKKTICN